MKTQTLVRVLPSLFLLGSLAAAQGDNGFLRGEGRYDVAFSYTRDYYDEFWVGEDRMSPDAVGEVERETGSLYLAYGLREDVDLVVSGNYVEAETDGTMDFDDEEDFQDLYLGAKWRAWGQDAGPGVVSALLAPSIKLPMTDYEDNDVTAIGDGQIDLRFRGIAHYQLGGLWASLETGYDRRNGTPEDEIPINVTLGGTIADIVTVMPFFSNVESRGGPDIGGGTFTAVQEEYTRYGIAAYARLNERLGLTAMWRTTGDGKNTGDADSFGFGIVFSY